MVTILLSLLMMMIASSSSLVAASSSRFSSPIQETTFDFIKTYTAAPSLAVFAYSSQLYRHRQAIDVIQQVAKKITLDHPSFQFFFIDGDNNHDFRSVGFELELLYIFTNFPDNDGIVKYTLPVTVEDLSTYIEHHYVIANSKDVIRFTNEDDFYDLIDSGIIPSSSSHSSSSQSLADDVLSSSPLPVFVKFYESWCQHCKRMGPNFAIAATIMKQQQLPIIFFEVECSSSSSSKEFCNKYQVNSFPTLFLFNNNNDKNNNNQMIKFENDLRVAQTYFNFFQQNINNFPSSLSSSSLSSSSNNNNDNKNDDNVDIEITNKKKKKKDKTSSPSSSSIQVDLSQLGTLLSDDDIIIPSSSKSQSQSPSSSSSMEERLSSIEQHLKQQYDLLLQQQQMIELLLKKLNNNQNN